eukprot:CAMPEP_0196822926 /NCGR_PEP_ID=MMETSP1362-20130617/85377_1 /TAXON_ID=163516 /ORGANISM="Leptocylindrus danicus, Strain CCMP1856" /LENGTH=153 /DNA_ID=CAMNT_0042202625 /DNA_START=219 /DNA_END=680 /DNA_ORIENTATION=+
MDNGGQRIATLLVYLNSLTDQDGGATVFRDLKDSQGQQLKVRPKRGNALLFFPATIIADSIDGGHDDDDDANGLQTTRNVNNAVPDDRTLHKGEQVKIGDKSSSSLQNKQKVIAQMWVHEREYQPAVPQGNCHVDAEKAVREMERKLGLVTDE